jgi:hypothetical protein
MSLDHALGAIVAALLTVYLIYALLLFLGEPRVNVLLLNLALDRQLGRPHIEHAQEDDRGAL